MMQLMFVSIIFLAIIIMLSLAISVGSYLLMSFGLMGLLKGINDKTPALAFVPYLNTYYLGRIGSKDPNKVSSLGIALVCLQVAVCFVSFFSGMLSGMFPQLFDVLSSDSVVVIIFVVITMLISLAYLVVFHITYSRIFMKYSKNGVLYTVLNILICGGILGNVFLFTLRNNRPIDEIKNSVVEQN